MNNIKSWVIIIYALVGLFNTFIANDKPILAKNITGLTSPCLHDFLFDLGLAEKKIYSAIEKYDWAIFPLIPYHSQSINASHGKQSPGWLNGHLLGTDHLGRDVMAGIVRGCFNSFKIGLFAILFSLLIGLLVGSSMAYFGNDKLEVSILQMIGLVITLFLGIFYFAYSVSLFVKITILIITLISIATIIKIDWQIARKYRIKIPLDHWLNNIIILRKAIPTLLLVLAFLPLFTKPSASNVIIILSVIGWTNIARHTRAESLSVLQKEYVQSSKLLGGGYWHILKSHLWPMIKPTIGVVAGFAFSSFLVLEASLSFLGIGLPPEEVSWGSMISMVRHDISLWWVALFPSIALFIIIYSFTTLFEKGEKTNNYTII